MTKNHQVLRSALDKKVSKNEPVTLDELAEFATITRNSGRMSDRVLFVRAKRLLAEEQQEENTGTEQPEE